MKVGRYSFPQVHAHSAGVFYFARGHRKCQITAEVHGGGTDVSSLEITCQQRFCPSKMSYPDIICIMRRITALEAERNT